VRCIVAGLVDGCCCVYRLREAEGKRLSLDERWVEGG